jgi:hypothetical protein
VMETHLRPDDTIVCLFVIVIIIAIFIPFAFFTVLDKVCLIFLVLPSTLRFTRFVVDINFLFFFSVHIVVVVSTRGILTSRLFSKVHLSIFILTDLIVIHAFIGAIVHVLHFLGKVSTTNDFFCCVSLLHRT